VLGALKEPWAIYGCRGRGVRAPLGSPIGTRIFVLFALLDLLIGLLST
jgi:hypothetical protein